MIWPCNGRLNENGLKKNGDGQMLRSEQHGRQKKERNELLPKTTIPVPPTHLVVVEYLRTLNAVPPKRHSEPEKKAFGERQCVHTEGKATVEWEPFTVILVALYITDVVADDNRFN